MKMHPAQVCAVLQQKGITNLFHANSVTTSLTFLREKALVSRGYAECRQLPQTPQYSDQKDKQVGVWNDVFVDTDDYHRRISDLNMYGPVLFTIRTEAIAALPAGTEVLVTKSNPTKWTAGQTAGDRYFLTQRELADALVRGTFDQMITIRARDGVLPFGKHLVGITLDDPKQDVIPGQKALEAALNRLNTEAIRSGIEVHVISRTCRDGCRCLEHYQREWARYRTFFGP